MTRLHLSIAIGLLMAAPLGASSTGTVNGSWREDRPSHEESDRRSKKLLREKAAVRYSINSSTPVSFSFEKDEPSLTISTDSGKVEVFYGEKKIEVPERMICDVYGHDWVDYSEYDEKLKKNIFHCRRCRLRKFYLVTQPIIRVEFIEP